MPKTSLKQTIKIGTLIGDKKVRLTFKRVMKIWVISVIPVAIAHGLMAYKVSNAQEEIQKLKAEIPQIEKKIKEESFLPPKGEVLETLYPAMDHLEKATGSFSEELDALTDAHAKGMWIEHVHLNRQTSYAKIVGYTDDATLVDDYLESLKEDEAFDGYDLKYVKIRHLESEKKAEERSRHKKRNKRGTKYDGLPVHQFIISTKKEDV